MTSPIVNNTIDKGTINLNYISIFEIKYTLAWYQTLTDRLLQIQIS